MTSGKSETSQLLLKIGYQGNMDRNKDYKEKQDKKIEQFLLPVNFFNFWRKLYKKSLY